jgi:hypothetical protein
MSYYIIDAILFFLVGMDYKKQKAWNFVYCLGGTGIPNTQINKSTPSVNIAILVCLKITSLPRQEKANALYFFVKILVRRYKYF